MFYILLFSLIICLFIFLIGLLLGFLKEESEKLFVLESGFSSLDNSFFIFSIQFFLILVIFVLFDLEIIFLISLLNLSFSSFFLVFSFILFVLLTLMMEFFWGKLSWFF